jgi:hypothetical protein
VLLRDRAAWERSVRRKSPPDGLSVARFVRRRRLIGLREARVSGGVTAGFGLWARDGWLVGWCSEWAVRQWRLGAELVVIWWQVGISFSPLQILLLGAIR